MAPRYPSSKTGYPIDLTAIEGSGEDFYQTAKTCIDRKLALYYVPGSEVDQARHVSLFAIGPIPLLAYLGSGMSDKIHVDLFQRHRDTGDWTWKQDGPVVEFETRLIRRGTNAGHVALLISISGTIVPATIPPAIDSSFDVHEIAPAGVAPGTEIMRRRESLDGFRAVYRRFLARVVQEHRECRCIHVFPAVPVPVAVAIGLDRMRHVQPHLAIYSNDGPEKGFVQAVTIGEIDAN